MYEQELATATPIPDVIEDFLLLFHELLKVSESDLRK